MAQHGTVDHGTRELIDALRHRAERRRRVKTSLIAGVALLLTLGITTAATTALRSPGPTATEPGPTASAPSERGSNAAQLVPPVILSSATPVPHVSGETPTDPTAGDDVTAAPVAASAAFDVDRAMEHIRRLATDIGVRAAGTPAEAAAAGYAVEYLTGLGYHPEIQVVPLPGDRTSQNVVATRPGGSAATIVIGAHLDSKSPAPGANDNASGAATVLELARSLRHTQTVPTLVFVLFGAEETVDGNEAHHHYGSREYVRTMTPRQRADLRAMISVDMVAYGDTFVVRSMGLGPAALTDALRTYATERGVALGYRTDTGPYGWSDHEPFELAGYPVAWVEWRDDPAYHTPDDTPEHCRPDRVEATGTLLHGFLSGLDDAAVQALARGPGG